MDSTNHPIEGLMHTAMESLKTMVDVNTILGDPVETPDGCVIVPVSRVSFGFAAGGTEFEAETKKQKEASTNEFPFGGGSGGGVALNPVAFLVVGQGQVRLLSVENNTALYDRLIDLVPRVVDQVQGAFKEGRNGKSQRDSFSVGPLRT